MAHPDAKFISDPGDELIVPASPEAIEKAAQLILGGKLVAFPTETVYGLGADATNNDAIAAVFAAKERPDFNPLIVHVADTEAAQNIAEFSPLACELAETFWPGALTLVVRRKEPSNLSPLISAGLDTIAIRVPDHPVAQAILRSCGCPVAAPSANRSGAVSPTNSSHVATSLGTKADLIIDGGLCRVGMESTVIDVSGEIATLLRPGGIAAEVIEAVIGPLGVAGDSGGAPKSPGMSDRHYAPEVTVRLNAEKAEPGEALLAFGPEAPRRALNLSRKGDLSEAAANFFAMIRALDQSGVRGIAVMPIPETGLGRAINDRLRRAASKTGN